MEELREACRLNNEGVHFHLKGDYQNSMTAFQTALGQMKLAAFESDKISREPVGTRAAVEQEFDICNIVQPPHAACSHSLLSGQCDSGFVYSLPFLLHAGSADSLDDVRVSLYSATLLFNLAMCFHRDGLQGRGKMLQRASNLYQMSLQLLEEPLREAPSASSVIATLLLNNKANCHFDLCEYDQSRHFSRHLSQMIEYARLQIEVELSPKVIEALYLTSSIMVDQVPTAAQAA